VSFVGAAALLRPPEQGLDYIRGDRAAELRLEPGGLTARDGLIAALEDDPGARLLVDARGCTLLPGLIDCHTHLPFAGWRAEEYERKVRGASYEEIARAGGGIAASARALRETADGDVLAQSRALAQEMLAAGTTTFECKSGYGLSLEGELRALRLAGELDAEVEQSTTSTALLAHAVPEGHSGDSWMDAVEAMLPAVAKAGHVSALDIFVESFAFTNQHLERMGELAARSGWYLRCHVEQLGTHRSVPVALASGARSVDHLSQLHPDVPRRGAPCARTGAARRRCDRRARDRRKSRDLAGGVAAAGDRAGRAALRAEHARGACGDDAERGVGARAGGRPRLARGGQAGRRDPSRRRRRTRRLPLRAQPGGRGIHRGSARLHQA
jgi:imidazolonepropionase